MRVPSVCESATKAGPEFLSTALRSAKDVDRHIRATTGYSPVTAAFGKEKMMPPILIGDLPETLQTVRTRPLFVARLDVGKPQIVGATPGGYRRIGVVPGGVFEGDRLSGVILDGGSDWQTVRPDGATTLDVRLVLKTHDDALITMTYRGFRYGPPDVMARLDGGEAVDPGSYYFRVAPLFETSGPKYDWLNRVIAVGIGHRPPGGPIYNVFEVL
jgi:hypothetical protein